LDIACSITCPATRTSSWLVPGNKVLLMVTLNGYPKNKDKFVRLIDFFKDVLDICKPLGVEPIVDGSLAVFAYSSNHEIEVNDVDTSIHEDDFPRVIKVLEERRIEYKLKEWHVLQVLKDDLKVELGSLEFWLKETPTEVETLKINGHDVQMLTLGRLKDFYRGAMETRLKGTDPNDKIKYGRLKEKYDVLTQV